MSKSTRVFGTAFVMGAMAISLIVPQAAFADVMDQWNRQSPGHGTSISDVNPARVETHQVRLLTGGTDPQVEVLGVRTRSESFSADTNLATSPLDQFLGHVQRESIGRSNPTPAASSATRLQSAPTYPSLPGGHETSPLDQFIGHELR